MITVGLKKEMVVTNGKLMVGKKNLDDGDIGCGNHDGGVHHNLYFTKGENGNGGNIGDWRKDSQLPRQRRSTDNQKC